MGAKVDVLRARLHESRDAEAGSKSRRVIYYAAIICNTRHNLFPTLYWLIRYCIIWRMGWGAYCKVETKDGVCHNTFGTFFFLPQWQLVLISHLRKDAVSYNPWHQALYDPHMIPRYISISAARLSIRPLFMSLAYELLTSFFLYFLWLELLSVVPLSCTCIL